MEKQFRAVQFGCGPIGCSVARLALERSNIELVGAVDIAADKVGKDFGRVAGLEKNLGIFISDNSESIMKTLKPDIVLHTTGSGLKDIFPQLEEIIKAGELSLKLDKLARENGVTVLGTGINPGFLMDAWPLFMTGVCKEVTFVKATRIQDASPRRLPFQKKIGAGCSIEEFNKRVNEGSIRHVGLSESINMIAMGLGWELDEIQENIEPVVAEKRTASNYLTVEKGQAAGVKQVGRGFSNGKEKIILDFQAYLGAGDPHDEVIISGTPEIVVRIEGGTHGDIGTASMVVNAVPRVVEAPPGLLTMKDIPIVVSIAV
jgi:4-hydroxy-tetrahydrodipicolinate reductase